jgi:hypothetical protein
MTTSRSREINLPRTSLRARLEACTQRSQISMTCSMDPYAQRRETSFASVLRATNYVPMQNCSTRRKCIPKSELSERRFKGRQPLLGCFGSLNSPPSETRLRKYVKASLPSTTSKVRERRTGPVLFTNTCLITRCIPQLGAWNSAPNDLLQTNKEGNSVC